jgi:hypothetical protein
LLFFGLTLTADLLLLLLRFQVKWPVAVPLVRQYDLHRAQQRVFQCSGLPGVNRGEQCQWNLNLTKLLRHVAKMVPKKYG